MNEELRVRLRRYHAKPNTMTPEQMARLVANNIWVDKPHLNYKELLARVRLSYENAPTDGGEPDLQREPDG